VLSRRVIFVLFDECEILDLAGPMQAFDQAAAHGAAYELQQYAMTPTIRTAQGIEVAGLDPLGEVCHSDVVLVPGYSVRTVSLPRAAVDWLYAAHARGALVCSVCTGAFALGEAGLLDGRQCTTHWKLTAELQARYPTARVLDERLFVEDRRVMTSAGIASGIDLALALIERDLGPLVAGMVARDLVVYLRRDAYHRQQSVYLDYRTHLNVGVHTVQDWVVAHPSERTRLPELASIAHMSVRNLTRAFRESTGISIHEFRTHMRLELAKTLMHDPDLTIEAIATRCGFVDSRQLRRLWRQAFGAPPSRTRSTPPSSATPAMDATLTEDGYGRRGGQAREAFRGPEADSENEERSDDAHAGSWTDVSGPILKAM
jgi:transcriptional regulator GlxA family with amidase domain